MASPENSDDATSSSSDEPVGSASDSDNEGLYQYEYRPHRRRRTDQKESPDPTSDDGEVVVIDGPLQLGRENDTEGTISSLDAEVAHIENPTLQNDQEADIDRGEKRAPQTGERYRQAFLELDGDLLHRGRRISPLSLPSERKMPTFENPVTLNGGPGLHSYGLRDKTGKEPKRRVLRHKPISHPAELVGTHNLLFFCTVSSIEGCQFNRVTEGSVVFKVTEGEKNSGRVLGTVLIDKNVQSKWPDWKVRMHAGGHTFDVSNIDDLLLHPDVDGRAVSGSVYKVTQPLVLRYAKESFNEMNQSSLIQAYYNSIPVDNVISVQTLIDDYQSGKSLELKWLSKLPTVELPAELKTRISQYATSKPMPAFILKRGDFLLEFRWEDRDRPRYAEYLVARRSSWIAKPVSEVR